MVAKLAEQQNHSRQNDNHKNVNVFRFQRAIIQIDMNIKYVAVFLKLNSITSFP